MSDDQAVPVDEQLRRRPTTWPESEPVRMSDGVEWLVPMPGPQLAVKPTLGLVVEDDARGWAFVHELIAWAQAGASESRVDDWERLARHLVLLLQRNYQLDLWEGLALLFGDREADPDAYAARAGRLLSLLAEPLRELIRTLKAAATPPLAN
jgi:hypothetical protein